MDIWQKPCLYKSDGSRRIVNKPSVCLLRIWFGINNLVAVPISLRSDYTQYKLPTTLNIRTCNKNLVVHQDNLQVDDLKLSPWWGCKEI